MVEEALANERLSRERYEKNRIFKEKASAL
jgi:hypothetical protein